MNLFLKHCSKIKFAEIAISGSKSETNRMLILQALFPEIQLKNSSDSDDSRAMTLALQSDSDVIDIHHAGTAMRFLTSYFAILEGRMVILTGSERMQQRPIEKLVDALREMGADIEFTNNDGFPPIKIVGQKLSASKVSIDASVSSQFISSLMLIGSKLPRGLEIQLQGKITSKPYLQLSIDLLNSVGIEAVMRNDSILISAKEQIAKTVFAVESDWSSASYFYSFVALSSFGESLKLSTFKKNSSQGDSSLIEIYKNFGVQTSFEDESIVLTKISTDDPDSDLFFDLSDTPDLAQTIVVTALGQNRNCILKGLHTLKIKETDRLVALQAELTKFGASVNITENSLELSSIPRLNNNVLVQTYQDHRMAMAFAPLVLRTNLSISESEVVTKSYPNFWSDLFKLGIIVKEVE
ncbi:3-phosphoshikimate 1-carboxyvinyltransferase [Flavobacterium ardleyense]|uniref:3-phosphoshikimate 1-carboxyvinyltransferase n=1 Tax=Flavobacterium ardleyense TaxID=2038737 RepID=UPI00298BFC0A|nr:3-phosphoshikimate 1-carboxyvinyltransferase [Flavobacterium ardleyense]